MHSDQVVTAGIPLKTAQKALVLLHGRGASGHDILHLGEHFNDGTFYLAAPEATGHSWYPFGFMEEESANEPWLTSAVETIHHLLKDIESVISLSNIYLMGFSQGACLALEVAGRYPALYGGVVAFTGGLIGKTVRPDKYQGDMKGTKVFIGNSDHDPHVPFARSQASKEVLERLGATVRLEMYPNMPHTIILQEIQAVKEFLFNNRPLHEAV